MANDSHLPPDLARLEAYMQLRREADTAAYMVAGAVRDGDQARAQRWARAWDSLDHSAATVLLP